MPDQISQLPRGSTVVEHTPRHPKVEGSNPAISAGGRERETFGGKSFYKTGLAVDLMFQSSCFQSGK